MDIRDAISKIEEFILEMEYLRGLPRGNQEYILWEHKVGDFLEAAFGKDSDECRRLSYAVTSYLLAESEEELRCEYQEHLTRYETALRSIITKYEMQGAVLDRYKNWSLRYWMEAVWHWCSTGLSWIRSHWKWSTVGAAVLIVLTVLGTNYEQASLNVKQFLNWLLSIVGLSSAS